jgi:hypothetical protein
VLLLVEVVALPTVNSHNQLGNAVTMFTTGHLHHWKTAVIGLIHSEVAIKELRNLKPSALLKNERCLYSYVRIKEMAEREGNNF